MQNLQIMLHSTVIATICSSIISIIVVLLGHCLSTKNKKEAMQREIIMKVFENLQNVRKNLYRPINYGKFESLHDASLAAHMESYEAASKRHQQDLDAFYNVEFILPQKVSDSLKQEAKIIGEKYQDLFNFSLKCSYDYKKNDDSLQNVNFDHFFEDIDKYLNLINNWSEHFNMAINGKLRELLVYGRKQN